MRAVKSAKSADRSLHSSLPTESRGTPDRRRSPSLSAAPPSLTAPTAPSSTTSKGWGLVRSRPKAIQEEVYAKKVLQHLKQNLPPAYTHSSGYFDALRDIEHLQARKSIQSALSNANTALGAFDSLSTIQTIGKFLEQERDRAARSTSGRYSMTPNPPNAIVLDESDVAMQLRELADHIDLTEYELVSDFGDKKQKKKRPSTTPVNGIGSSNSSKKNVFLTAASAFSPKSKFVLSSSDESEGEPEPRILRRKSAKQMVSEQKEAVGAVFASLRQREETKREIISDLQDFMTKQSDEFDDGQSSARRYVIDQDDPMGFEEKFEANMKMISDVKLRLTKLSELNQKVSDEADRIQFTPEVFRQFKWDLKQKEKVAEEARKSMESALEKWQEAEKNVMLLTKQLDTRNQQLWKLKVIAKLSNVTSAAGDVPLSPQGSLSLSSSQLLKPENSAALGGDLTPDDPFDTSLAQIVDAQTENETLKAEVAVLKGKLFTMEQRHTNLSKAYERSAAQGILDERKTFTSKFQARRAMQERHVQCLSSQITQFHDPLFADEHAKTTSAYQTLERELRDARRKIEEMNELLEKTKGSRGNAFVSMSAQAEGPIKKKLREMVRVQWIWQTLPSILQDDLGPPNSTSDAANDFEIASEICKFLQSAPFIEAMKHNHTECRSMASELKSLRHKHEAMDQRIEEEVFKIRQEYASRARENETEGDALFRQTRMRVNVMRIKAAAKLQSIQKRIAEHQGEPDSDPMVNFLKRMEQRQKEVLERWTKKREEIIAAREKALCSVLKGILDGPPLPSPTGLDFKPPISITQRNRLGSTPFSSFVNAKTRPHTATKPPGLNLGGLQQSGGFGTLAVSQRSAGSTVTAEDSTRMLPPIDSTRSKADSGRSVDRIPSAKQSSPGSFSLTSGRVRTAGSRRSSNTGTDVGSLLGWGDPNSQF